MTLMQIAIVILFSFLSTGYADPLPSIVSQTRSMEKQDGFFTFYWDEQNGRIFLEIGNWEEEFLYVDALSTGVGSNDIGLDRGKLGQNRVVKFHRVGRKVLLVQPNYNYRAGSDNPLERQSVEEAFAQSILGGFTAIAVSGDTFLVDATDFLMRDAHNVIGTLKNTSQGAYQLDENRSAFFLPRTKAFPQNCEFETILTFAGSAPGGWVRQVTPTPQAITVRQRHSFVKLPDNNYQPRAFDPRSGLIYIRFLDYSTPIGIPMEKRLITRHRLEKKFPDQAISEPLEPIVYYVDAGTPEPIRSALIEGASWWDEAFEAIGFRNAFQVKVLPPDADPLDIRYNVIQWVHRSTRGWSYGGFVNDPRTGEILKGHVSLGSLRVRQDFLIAEGLLAPYEEGKAVSPEMEKMALARLRQLSAHEVGHTLGFTHNFAASVSDRASVMDYPHPLARLNDKGQIDLSDAYDSGIGGWDKFTVAYGYSQFPESVAEKAALDGLVQNNVKSGSGFIGDNDARPAGGAHPEAHLWDTGRDPAQELERMMTVRLKALQGFSSNTIPVGTPMSRLEEVLVPVYLMHRYQVEAAAKVLGGLRYSYAVRGDGQSISIPSPEAQMQALHALLLTLQPEQLAMPEKILALIPPKAYGEYRGRESFKIRTGVTLDALAAAETAADLTLRMLFNPARANRLVEQHARNPKMPGLHDIIEKVVDNNLKKAYAKDPYLRAVNQSVAYRAVVHLLALAVNADAGPLARSVAHSRIRDISVWLNKKAFRGEKDFHEFVSLQIHRYLEDPDKWVMPLAPGTPDGSPIGSDLQMGCEAGFQIYW